ncbi:MAG: hypothetical protein ACPG5B_03300 [Chitinophagales bacterium]
MQEKLSLKLKLQEICLQQLTKNIELLQERLKTLRESKNSETKSTAGDKHETGRAMIQLEEENTHKRLSEVLDTKNKLARINCGIIKTTAQSGSIVITDKAKYVILVGIGKVKLENTLYYCVSQHSPIAKVLLQKQAGDEFVFNGKKIKIKEVF